MIRKTKLDSPLGLIDRSGNYIAKGDRDTFMNQYNQNRNSAQGGQNQLMQNLYGQLYGYANPTSPYKSSATGQGLYGQGETERSNLISGWNGLMGGLQPDVTNNLRSIQTPQINSPAYSGYQGLTGYNPSFQLNPGLYGNVQGLSNQLRDIQWNPADVATSRNAISGLTGNIAGWQNFADTGGLTDADRLNFRARSNAPVGAYYSNQQNELERLGNQAQGNPYALAAARSNLARQGAQQLSDVSQGTESNLTNLINQYKTAGLTGVQQGLATQAQLANQLAQGQANTQLYGLNSAADLQRGLLGQDLQSQIAAGQLGLQGRLAGLSGMSDIDRANLSAQLAGNQLRAGNEQFIGAQNLGAREAGLQGQQGLYGMVHGPSTEIQRQLLNQFNVGDAAQRDYLRLLLGGLGGIPSDASQRFGNILGGIGAGAGVLSGLFGGQYPVFGRR